MGIIEQPGLTEVSGVVASWQHPGTLWVHDDSGSGADLYAIDGETAAFYDLGGFKWTPDLPNGQVGKCDGASYVDSAMTTDQPIDTTAKPTITLAWQLGTKCYGVQPKNAPWTTGASDVDIQVEPTGPGGNSAQKVRLNYVP